jgi:tRNA(fMet)-specific endonuclease VapC
MSRKVYVLDNDTLTLSLQGNRNVVRRILATSADDIWLPAAAVEEQLRGRLAVLSSLNSARVSDRSKIPQAYELLLETVRELQRFRYLSYTADMETLYQSWPATVKRVGTRDCRIAATAIAHEFTVVTCNLSHFQLIPGVTLEDWSR